jgi:hypothetical protein
VLDFSSIVVRGLGALAGLAASGVAARLADALLPRYGITHLSEGRPRTHMILPNDLTLGGTGCLGRRIDSCMLGLPLSPSGVRGEHHSVTHLSLRTEHGT